MKARVCGVVLLAVCFVDALAAPASSVSEREQRDLLAQIDTVSRCIGLQRQGPLQEVQKFDTFIGGYRATVILMTDGVARKYAFDFTGDRRLIAFTPIGYRIGWELPHVRDPHVRKRCLDAVSRLDRCPIRWGRYGTARVERDGPRRYRVTYKARPEKDLADSHSLYTNVYFLLTRRGTICGVWTGE